MVKNSLKTILKNLKKILYPIIYSYPGYIFYGYRQKLRGYKKEKRRIYRSIGYYPNLKNPKSYNEKILWKKINDRNPLLPVVSDKYRVRDYLRNVLGQKEAEKILVPLLYVTDKPETIPFDSLLGEYIIKPNHASERYIVAEETENQKKFYINYGNKKTLLYDCKKSRNDIICLCKEWLSEPYGFYVHEWAYQKIKRKIVIEKLLRDKNGKIPFNYYFSVFNGKCHLITVIYNRFEDKGIARYAPDWKYLNVKSGTRQADYEKKPENLQTALELAELLGKPFDSIRVDLYLIYNRIYFGELTNYPMSGGGDLNPVSFDFELGLKWKHIPNYWKNKNQ